MQFTEPHAVVAKRHHNGDLISLVQVGSGRRAAFHVLRNGNYMAWGVKTDEASARAEFRRVAYQKIAR